MRRTITYCNITGNDNNSTHQVTITLPDHCSICSTSLQPTFLSAFRVIETDTLYVLYFCTKCMKCFFARYDTSPSLPRLIDLTPHSTKVTVFSEEIQALSPEFVEIYNQAEVAENSGLHHICGPGYRKALEYLVKDYALSISPTREQDIKTMALSRCIKEFITHPSLATLAERAAWIGNDETHYIRKWETRDVTDLKKFIAAAVHFIDMLLIVADADSMNPSDPN